MFKNINFKFVIIMSLFLILSFLSTGCKSNKVSESNNITENMVPESNNSTKKMAQLLAISCFEKNADISIYKLDTITKKANLLKTQATPGVFMPSTISDDDNLYYPKLDSGGKFAQLFKFNLISQKETQLTSLEKNGIILVQSLYIDNSTSKIFMLILRKNHQNSEVASYNLKTEEMKVFGNQDKDTEVLNFDICKDKKLVAVATYSKMANSNNMVKASKSQLALEAAQYSFTIYDEDGNKVKECNPIKDFVNDISLSPDAKLLLISINTEWLDDDHSKKNIFCTQNVQTGEIKQVLKSSEQFQEIKNARYSADGSGFFYLATKANAKSFVNNGGYTKVINTIFYYDLKTNKSKEVWGPDNKTITYYGVLDK